MTAAHPSFAPTSGLIEFIIDHTGCKWTYDVNVNTNYNAEAELRAGVNARVRLAQYLKKELAQC